MDAYDYQVADEEQVERDLRYWTLDHDDEEKQWHSDAGQGRGSTRWLRHILMALLVAPAVLTSFMILCAKWLR
jgi:hypothetical protein